jgi:hypothetical protein
LPWEILSSFFPPKVRETWLNLLQPKEVVKNITIFFIYSSSMKKIKIKIGKTLSLATSS